LPLAIIKFFSLYLRSGSTHLSKSACERLFAASALNRIQSVRQAVSDALRPFNGRNEPAGSGGGGGKKPSKTEEDPELVDEQEGQQANGEFGKMGEPMDMDDEQHCGWGLLIGIDTAGPMMVGSSELYNIY
jgi:hypothetical protein